MGRLVQVSLLGRGRPAGAGVDGRPACYESVVYRFAGEFEFKTPLFAYGLWCYLEASDRRPDTVVLLGTAGSMWDALWEALPEGAQLSEETLAWHAALHRACLEHQVTPEMLDVTSAPLDALPFSRGLQAALIPDCRNETDIIRFCEILMSQLEPGDDILLDITHGYRHLPVLAAFLTTSLRWLRGITVRGVFYGALEMAGRCADGPTVAPVLDLGYAATLFERGAACATYEITGRYGALAPFFPEQAGDMLTADYYENLTQTARARNAALRLANSFPGTMQDDPWLAAVAAKLADEWRWTQNSQLHQRMLSQAENLFRHGEYFKSIAMLHESFGLYACKRVFGEYKESLNERQREDIRDWLGKNLPAERQKVFDLLRVLRNVLIHNNHHNQRKAQPLIEDRTRMHAFLKKAFAAARAQFNA